jgi:hypothetical protein
MTIDATSPSTPEPRETLVAAAILEPDGLTCGIPEPMIAHAPSGDRLGLENTRS